MAASGEARANFERVDALDLTTQNGISCQMPKTIDKWTEALSSVAAKE